MATYLVQKNNKLAIAMIERIQNSNEPCVLCSTQELREFNNNVTVLPDEELDECEYFPSLTYTDTLRQAQREYNFDMAKMAEDAALGIKNFRPFRDSIYHGVIHEIAKIKRMAEKLNTELEMICLDILDVKLLGAELLSTGRESPLNHNMTSYGKITSLLEVHGIRITSQKVIN